MCRQSRGRSSCSGCDACVGAFTVTHSCIRCSLRVCFRITRLGRRYHGFSATDHPKLMLVKGRNWPKTGNREGSLLADCCRRQMAAIGRLLPLVKRCNRPEAVGRDQKRLTTTSRSRTLFIIHSFIRFRHVISNRSAARLLATAKYVA